MSCNFNGVGVALVTPFNENGTIDFNALRTLVDNVVKGGVDYIVALGTTAETPTLTHDEQMEVVRTVLECNASRVPVVMGLGGNNTADVCARLQALDTTGLSAVLSVTPYYNKPSQEGLYQHYRAIAQASPLPVILYNVPGRTGVNMAAETTLRLARDFNNICAIKEACGKIEQMKTLIQGAPEGFSVLSGDDGMTLPLIAAGGQGVISVVANAFTEKFCDMVHVAMDGRMDEAEAAWDDLKEICPMLFEEGNPVGIKAALAIKQVCSPAVRLPLVEASAQLRERMKHCMNLHNL